MVIHTAVMGPWLERVGRGRGVVHAQQMGVASLFSLFSYIDRHAGRTAPSESVDMLQYGTRLFRRNVCQGDGELLHAALVVPLRICCLPRYPGAARRVLGRATLLAVLLATAERLYQCALLRHNFHAFLTSCMLRPTNHQFHECWWDSLIIDLLGANILGMVLGLYTLRFLETRTFDWNSKEGSHKLARSVVRE